MLGREYGTAHADISMEPQAHRTHDTGLHGSGGWLAVHQASHMPSLRHRLTGGMTIQTISLMLFVLALGWTSVTSATTRPVSSGDALQSAVTASSSGDEVVLQSGDYTLPRACENGQFSCLKIPSSASGLTIRVASGAQVILRQGIEFADGLRDLTLTGAGGALIIDGGENGRGGRSSACLWGNDVHRLRLESFECRWTTSGWEGVIHDSVFKDLHIHHFGITPDGYASRSCYEAMCTNCSAGCELCWSSENRNPRIDRCHAVYTQGNSSGNTFDGMCVHDGDGHAIHLYGVGSDWAVRNGVFYKNRGQAIGIYNYISGVVLENNQIDGGGECRSAGPGPVPPPKKLPPPRNFRIAGKP